MSKIQVGIGCAVTVAVPPPMVVVPTAVKTTLVVVVHLAHERLLAQGCWGTVQMEVVMVERHELPAPVTIGNVVGGAVVRFRERWEIRRELSCRQSRISRILCCCEIKS